MVHSRGWEWVKKYYQGKIQLFANDLLLKEKEPIESFENQRRELIGLRKLIGMIDNDMKAVEDERRKTVAKK